MALENEAWFIHQVSENVTHLAQQKRSKTTGCMRVKEGVVGKTWPFNRLGELEMNEVTTRDADTQYLNPPQSKRRAVLRDFAAAVLVDSFDEVKELANAQSEFAQMLAYSRNRRTDRLAISIDGRTAAGGAATATGGILGNAITVDEAAETTSTGALPSTQQIVHGSVGLTFEKVNQALRILNENDAEDEEKFFFVSPQAIEDLLAETEVTSSDFSTLKAIQTGGFPMDHMWMGFHWRMTTLLPKESTTRKCIAMCKMGVGAAFSSVQSLSIDKAVHKNNSIQVLAKLSGGVVRIDDDLVVQVDITES